MKTKKESRSLKVALRKNSILRYESLYELESIMGECDGHGCGFGGEDIDWQIKKGRCWWKTLYINCDGRRLDISYSLYFDDAEVDPIPLPLSTLPYKWKNKLIRVLKENTNKRTIPGNKKLKKGKS